MSSVLPSDDPLTHDSGDPIAPGDTTATAAPAAVAPPSTPVLALPATLPADPLALLETIRRGLDPTADDAARAAARELWARLAPALASVTPRTATAPDPAAMPQAFPIPSLAGMPPVSPIAMAAHALRQMTPDQLLDLVLQRVRAALPTGATVAAPRGIQFQLVPVSPPLGR